MFFSKYIKRYCALTLIGLCVTTVSSCNTGYFALEEPLSFHAQILNVKDTVIPISLQTNKEVQITYSIKEGDGYFIINNQEIKDSHHSFQASKGQTNIEYIPKSGDPVKIDFSASSKNEKIRQAISINTQQTDFGWWLNLQPGNRKPNRYQAVKFKVTIDGPGDTYKYKLRADRDILIRLNTGQNNDMYKRENNIKLNEDMEPPKGQLTIDFFVFPYEAGPATLQLLVTDPAGNTINKKILYQVQDTESDNKIEATITHLDGLTASNAADPYIYHHVDLSGAGISKKPLVIGLSLAQKGTRVPYIPEDAYTINIQPAQGTSLPDDFFKLTINKNVTLSGEAIDYDTYIFAQNPDKTNAIALEVNRPERFTEMNEKVKINITLTSTRTGNTFTIGERTIRVNIKKKTD